MNQRFRDRTEAGQLLAHRLVRYTGHTDVHVLALPRGGVPVAFEVARELQVPLDVLVVRKLGLPGQEELAMGALATGGVCVLNYKLIAAMHIPNQVVDRVTLVEQAELERREQLYRTGRPAPVLRDQTVILVDDGLATGTTMRAAIKTVRAQQPARIVVAVPVIARECLAELRPLVDDLVWVFAPVPFVAIGCWYSDFTQTSDAQVCALLERAISQPTDERLRYLHHVSHRVR